ncbi:MAG: ribosomal RNA small subunit methyltransferase A, partial [Planctomycetota bacterium]
MNDFIEAVRESPQSPEADPHMAQEKDSADSGGPPLWSHKKGYLVDLFSRRSIHPLRKLGQNFILDPNLLDFIVKTAAISEKDTVLEVGVGTGQLTSRMIAKARSVVGIEVDRNLHEVASEAMGRAPNLRLIRADALASKNRLNPEVIDAVKDTLPAEGGRLLLVSNLAYRIATPLILNLLESDLPVSSMTVTIQMEVAERISAKIPGDHGYGPVSVLVGSFGDARIVRPVPRDVFWPKPKIQSAIVRIDLEGRTRPASGDYDRFKTLVKGL